MQEVYKREHVRPQERLSEPSDHGAGLTLSEGERDGRLGGSILDYHAAQENSRAIREILRQCWLSEESQVSRITCLDILLLSDIIWKHPVGCMATMQIQSQLSSSSTWVLGQLLSLQPEIYEVHSLGHQKWDQRNIQNKLSMRVCIITNHFLISLTLRVAFTFSFISNAYEH